MSGRNRLAVGVMLRALADGGRLERCDEALVVLVRSLADAVDQGGVGASLWREYRQALELLLGTVGGRSGDDFDQLLAELNVRSEVGDTPEG